MLNALRPLLAASALALLAGAASAATFTGNFAVDTSGPAFSEPGLVVNVAPTAGFGTFDLELGNSISFNLFDIWTNEASVNGDDLTFEPFSVSFNLTAPAAGGVNAGGQSGGEKFLFGAVQKGKLTWDAPVTLAFGNGGALKITMFDATFNKGIFWGLDEGQKYGAHVKAKVEYIAEPVFEAPAPVPLPAAGVLLAAGLGGLGLMRRRKG